MPTPRTRNGRSLPATDVKWCGRELCHSHRHLNNLSKGEGDLVSLIIKKHFRCSPHLTRRLHLRHVLALRFAVLTFGPSRGFAKLEAFLAVRRRWLVRRVPASSSSHAGCNREQGQRCFEQSSR